MDDNDAADELDVQAEMVAQLLAEGCSDAEATMAIGRTAKWAQRRRRDDPAFVARIENLKAQRVAQASAGLGALLERAVKAVERNLDETSRASDQLQAARLVFDRFRVFRGDVARETLLEMRAELAELRGQVKVLSEAANNEEVS